MNQPTGEALAQALHNAHTERERADILNQYAWLMRRKDPAEALKLARQALEISANYPAGRAEALATLGSIQLLSDSYDESLTNSELALEIALGNGEKRAQARALNTIGWLKRRAGMNNEALQHFMETLSLAREIDDLQLVAYALNSISSLHMALGNHERARAWMQESIAIRESMGDTIATVHALYNMAALLRDINEYSSSLDYALRSLSLARSIEYGYGQAMAAVNAGETLLKLKQPSEAFGYFMSAHEFIAASDDFKYMIPTIENGLGMACVDLGATGRALGHFQRALQYAVEAGDKMILMDIYAAIASLYRRTGDFERALDYTEHYYNIRETIYNEERTRTVQALEAQHRIQQVETELKNQHMQREQEAQYFKSLMRMKDDLIAMTSHDIKSPLSVILTNAYFIRRKVSDEAVIQRVAVIEDQTRNIGDMITDMLEMVYLESGGQTDKKVDWISAFVGQVLDAFEPECIKRNVSLVFEPLMPDIHYNFDPQQFNRMLHNLLSNAIRYTPEHGKISAALYRDPGGLVISISDTGRGIATNDLPHIFEKYYVGSAERRDMTRGLGLVIVKLIVENHGGSVHVSSIEGKGTTFRIMLPLHDD